MNIKIQVEQEPKTVKNGILFYLLFLFEATTETLSLGSTTEMILNVPLYKIVRRVYHAKPNFSFGMSNNLTDIWLTPTSQEKMY